MKMGPGTPRIEMAKLAFLIYPQNLGFQQIIPLNCMLQLV